jgi:hypothetical protein
MSHPGQQTRKVIHNEFDYFNNSHCNILVYGVL